MLTQNIYKRVLEIGSECLECGISFTDLKRRLKDEDFDVDNECLNRCLREWFFNSFFHEETVCTHGNSSIKDLDKHLGCNFILKAETYDTLNKSDIFSHDPTEKQKSIIRHISAISSYIHNKLEDQLTEVNKTEFETTYAGLISYLKYQ